jgi:adenylate cyclase
VFEQVRNKLTLSFDFLGPQSVKNIAEAVPAWRIVLNGGARKGNQDAGADGPVVAGAARSSVGISVAEAPPRRSWFRARREHRPRSAAQLAATAGVLIAALFTINMLTSSDSLWFQWPTLVIIVIFALRMIWAWRG